MFGRAIDVQWGANLRPSHLAPGGYAKGIVSVTNHGAVAGTIMTPGCPVLVGHPPAFCPRPSHIRVIGPGRHLIWTWGRSATSDGTRTGKPLPAGVYTITIGGATVSMTVT